MAVAVVPARAPDDTMFLDWVVVYADRIGELCDSLHQVRLGEFTRAVGSPCGRRPRQIGVHESPGDRVDQGAGNLVADNAGGLVLPFQRVQRERIPRRIAPESIAPDTSAVSPGAERIIELVTRVGSQEFGEVAAAHRLARNSRGSVVAWTRFGDAFYAVHEERLVSPVVELRYYNRSPKRSAPSGVIEIREGDVIGVAEEVIGEQRSRHLGIGGRPVERVRSRLDAKVGHAAFGVAEAGVESRGLDLEFLDQVLGRNERSDDFAGVGRGGAGHAVDRKSVV